MPVNLLEPLRLSFRVMIEERFLKRSVFASLDAAEERGYRGDVIPTEP